VWQLKGCLKLLMDGNMGGEMANTNAQSVAPAILVKEMSPCKK
jgi:hypothetical protein